MRVLPLFSSQFCQGRDKGFQWATWELLTCSCDKIFVIQTSVVVKFTLWRIYPKVYSMHLRVMCTQQGRVSWFILLTHFRWHVTLIWHICPVVACFDFQSAVQFRTLLSRFISILYRLCRCYSRCVSRGVNNVILVVEIRKFLNLRICLKHHFLSVDYIHVMWQICANWVPCTPPTAF